MKYTILVIVSCYIELTHGVIAPRGIAENGTTILRPVINSTIVSAAKSTHKLLEKINTSLNLLKDALEKDLLADPQEKASEINQRAFIYIKSLKPVHNKIYLAQKDDRSYMMQEDRLYEDLQHKLMAVQNKKELAYVKDTDNPNISGSGCNNSIQRNSKRIKGLKKLDKSHYDRREFLELLKIPLLRTLVKSDVITQNSNKQLEAKMSNKGNKMSKSTVPNLIKNYHNEDYSEAKMSGEVDKLIEQFMNISLEKPRYELKHAGMESDCNNHEGHDHQHTTCKCKTGPFATDNNMPYNSYDEK